MAKRQATTKKVKKKWFPIIAPKMFGEKVLGESLLADSSLMKGRHLTQNLSNIINDPKKHSIKIQFLIKDVKEGQGITEIIKYELIPAYTKRLIRRGRSKIADSFIAKSADGKRVRVKTLIVTNSYAHKSTETRIRLFVRDLMKKEVAKNTFEKSIEDLLKLVIQKEMRKKISKIAPSRNFEIRVFKLARKETHGEEEEKEVKVEEVKEVPKEEVKQKPEVSELGNEKVSKKEDKKEEAKEEPKAKEKLEEEVKPEEASEEEKKPAAKKAPAKKPAAKKEVKKAPAKKAPTKKAAPKKASVKKSSAKK